jgi:hypothetical protein
MTDNPTTTLATNRIRVMFIPEGPDASGRRLWLRTTDFAGSPLKDAELRLHVGDMQRLDAANGVWESTMRGRLAHVGRWPRYRQEIALAWAVLDVLGWRLTADEERTMNHLEVTAAAAAA